MKDVGNTDNLLIDRPFHQIAHLALPLSNVDGQHRWYLSIVSAELSTELSTEFMNYARDVDGDRLSYQSIS